MLGRRAGRLWITFLEIKRTSRIVQKIPDGCISRAILHTSQYPFIEGVLLVGFCILQASGDVKVLLQLDLAVN